MPIDPLRAVFSTGSRWRLATAFVLAWHLSGSPCWSSDVVIDGKTFRVPDGFVLEKVVGPPLVDRPIVADFDELGRLYVADSSGSNENVKKQVVDRPHRIVRLEDTDGDGKFDRSVVFADKMMFPEGAMWLDGSLYVAAPPSIWKLTDTDGDGVADRREEWFQGKTLTGCANDLHGPYAGLDGRIYWCKGAFAPQTYDRPGKKPLQTRAAHLLRAKPDGTDVEPVMTGGMDNPVEVVFTPEGERIFNTTFLQHPAGGKRDGLIHALYGGVYGKDHDVIDGHPRTGPELLPTLVHLGPAAPSGLMRAESNALGRRDSLFTTCFNLRKVTRTLLQPEGGSFWAETEDFVVSDDLDFHPTDVLEDADGSLLIVDTGGWYKLCCPTSQLVKPDLLGAIYRLKPIRPTQLDDPRGRTLDWNPATAEQLAERLGDPRPAVRRRAIASLARLRERAFPVMGRVIQDGGLTVETRRNVLWAASRIDAPDARAIVRIGLDDRDPSVRQVAVQVAGLWRDSKATSRLIEVLLNDSPAIRRASAEALGRLDREGSSIPVLLKTSESPDFALRHSATYALIEINYPEKTRPGLESPSPLVVRSALIAIDQMEGGRIDSASVIASLSSPVSDLRETAWWIAGRHPEWGDAVADYFRTRMSTTANHPEDRIDLERRLASMARWPEIQALLEKSLSRSGTVDPMILRVLARSNLKEIPVAWIQGLSIALASRDKMIVAEAVATTKALRLKGEASKPIAESLLNLAKDIEQPADLRLDALSAVPGGLASVPPEVFDFLLEAIRPDRTSQARATAADVVARAKLDSDQFLKLTKSLEQAGPLEASRLIDAFDKAEGDEVGLNLVASLGKSPARSSLRIETLKPKLDRFGPRVKAQAESLYRAIETDGADRRSRLEDLLANLKGGDIRRGQAVFNGSKASCVSCHAIGYVGGKLGPDMTRIGQVRTERDLLESIVFPSASFVRSYEPISVATKDGKVISGLLRQESGDEVVVAVAADREERIARDRIEEIQPGTVSVMPAGLDRQLTSGELADLIAFLKACR